jgi:hypothetical protein
MSPNLRQVLEPSSWKNIRNRQGFSSHFDGFLKWGYRLVTILGIPHDYGNTQPLTLEPWLKPPAKSDAPRPWGKRQLCVQRLVFCLATPSHDDTSQVTTKMEQLAKNELTMTKPPKHIKQNHLVHSRVVQTTCRKWSPTWPRFSIMGWKWRNVTLWKWRTLET